MGYRLPGGPAARIGRFFVLKRLQFILIEPDISRIPCCIATNRKHLFFTDGTKAA
jgi:hypothetical protein